jgi:hypothetical protein
MFYLTTYLTGFGDERNNCAAKFNHLLRNSLCHLLRNSLCHRLRNSLCHLLRNSPCHRLRNSLCHLLLHSMQPHNSLKQTCLRFWKYVHRQPVRQIFSNAEENEVLNQSATESLLWPVIRVRTASHCLFPWTVYPHWKFWWIFLIRAETGDRTCNCYQQMRSGVKFTVRKGAASHRWDILMSDFAETVICDENVCSGQPIQNLS